MERERSAELAPRRSRRSWVALAPLAVLLFGAGYTVVALGLPLQSALGPGPGFVPLLIGLLIVICAAWALLTRTAAIPMDQPFPRGEEAGRVPLLVALLAAYVVLLVPLGHLLSATLMASASAWVLGRRPWWLALGIGIVLSVGSWVLFDLLLGMPLPSGPLS